MNLKERSYPHPVLGNRDDVPKAAFQATLEMTADKETVYLDVVVTCSSVTLNNLIRNRKADIVCHVECSNTLYRKAFKFQETKFKVSIPASALNSVVDVNVFVASSILMPKFLWPEAHSDYGGASFDIRHGDILAFAEGQRFPVDSNFESFGRIGSIMQVAESPKDGDLPIRPLFDQDKLLIYLSKSDFAEYKLLRQHEGIAGPLTTLLVLPVLAEALHEVQRSACDSTDGRRWVRVLVRRIEEHGPIDSMDVFETAQTLLESPFKRALAHSRTLAEAIS